MNIKGKAVPMFAIWLLLIMTGVLVYMGFERSQALREQYAPPIRYSVAPDLIQPPICPGDTLRYTYGLEVLPSAVPMALTIDRGIWSVAERDFVVASRVPVTYPYNEPVSITRVRSYNIPLVMDDGKTFPAGDYKLMVTGEAEARKTVGFSIPFQLKRRCGIRSQ